MVSNLSNTPCALQIEWTCNAVVFQMGNLDCNDTEMKRERRETQSELHEHVMQRHPKCKRMTIKNLEGNDTKTKRHNIRVTRTSMKKKRRRKR